MNRPNAHPVVHLELQTANLPRARAFYTELFGWSAEAVRAGSASYLALELGVGIQGGIVSRAGDPPAWLPYVEVADIEEVAERARQLRAAVRIGPREGPAGWRCVLAVPSGAEIALWQPKI
jgi:predicted enzyme related to lactoylglutathione lyase